MSSGTEEKCVRKESDEERQCNQVKTELVAEILEYQKFQEEIVQKINESKKALHDEEKHVLHQAEKIKEIDAAVMTSSKALEQEMYEHWKFTQDLSTVRNLCQEVNAYSEKADDVLNNCEPDLVEYEKQVLILQGILEKRKAIINFNLAAQKRKLKQSETDFEKEKTRSDKEDLIKKIAQCKHNIQIEIETSLELRGNLGEVQERKDQVRKRIAAGNAENTSLQNRLLERGERKQHLLAKIESNRQSYNAKINEMRSTLKDENNKLQQITAENETIEKELREQSNAKENILSDIDEYSKQLDCYKQKCSEIETEENQMQEELTQNYNEAANKKHKLIDQLAAAEQNLSDGKETRSQLEVEVTALIEELQRDYANIENLKSEILKLQSLNETKAREVSEKKISIVNTSTSIVKISNELFDVTKKLNEREIEKTQALIKITTEIHELQKEIEELQAAEDAKLKVHEEEMESLKIEARDNQSKQQERAKEIEKYLALADTLRKECNSVVDNTKQLENDLQGVTLEHDILLKKDEELQKSRSNLMLGQKGAKIMEKPRVYKKQAVDEMSDSSMEGTISVQEHLKRQKIRAHKSSLM